MKTKVKADILFTIKQDKGSDIRSEDIFPQVNDSVLTVLHNLVKLYEYNTKTVVNPLIHIIKIEKTSFGIRIICSDDNCENVKFPVYIKGLLDSLTEEPNCELDEYRQMRQNINQLQKIGIQEITLETDNDSFTWSIAQLPIEKINVIVEEMPDKIEKGLFFLNKIIGEIAGWVKPKTNYPFIQNPKFVFRGITRFYPDVKEIDEDKTEKERVENDNIKSSLAVRLRDTSKSYIRGNNYTRAFYVNALEDIIRKAKKMYPNKYSVDMSDLDILADIQHNGGATCLVDFSKNLLTSIWFACNADPLHNGYVYCYDIMEDMIRHDKLTIIRPEDENRKIAELLAQTYRETNVCSDVVTRFCLWEPSKKNNRMFRQDSVFVFGIEKFKVNEHAIKVVEIEAKWKSAILTAMKAIFNISGSSVYNDHIGFANNINKIRPYRKMLDNVYTRGYANMLKGHYASALDFLKLAEIDFIQQKRDDKDFLELHFSLGVCYKSLARQNEKVHYLENAIIEYGKVIKLVNKSTTPEFSNYYYRHKLIRALNARTTLFYKLERYEDALDECICIMENIYKWNNLKKDKDEDKMFLTSQYCELSMLELFALTLLRHTKNSEEFCKKQKLIKTKIDNCKKEYSLSTENNHNQFNFFTLLDKYYNFIIDIASPTIVCSQSLKDSVMNTICSWNDSAREYINMIESNAEKDKSNGYILWNFTDIKNVIDSIKEDSFLCEKTIMLQDLTAGAIALRDLYEMHGWWSVDQV